MKFAATGRTLTITEAETLVAGTINDYTAEFTFDESWDGWTIRAVFRNISSHVSKEVLLDESRICTIPWETLSVGQLKVGIYGTKGDITRPTMWADRQYVNAGTKPAEPTRDPSPDLVEQIIEKIRNEVDFGGSGSGGKTARISYVTLTVDGWQGNESPYSQVVEIEGATENSKVDLTPSVEQLAIFYDKDLTFVTENDNGTITVYAIGQKPQNEYTIQVTLTEVIR